MSAVPESAVEAAARAIHADEVAQGYCSDEWEYVNPKWYRHNARAALAAAAPEIERAAKVAALRDFQHQWEDEPAEIESHTGRAVRRIIAAAFKSAADELEALP